MASLEVGTICSQLHDQSNQLSIPLYFIRKDDVLRHYALFVLHPEGVLFFGLVGAERPVFVLEVNMREEKSIGLGLDRAEEDLDVK